jgi:hypothetical protein
VTKNKGKPAPRGPQQMGHSETESAFGSRADCLVSRVLGRARLVRIGIVTVIALLVTLAVSPVVDEIYLRYFFSMDTRGLPAYVSAAFGLIAYVIGWWLVVGWSGQERQARPAVLWYLGIGIMALLVDIMWLASWGLSL